MDQIEQPDEITIRYAESDDDAIAIHQLLLVLGPTQARAPIDAIAGLHEILRVIAQEVALMAIRNGHLVGTMGIVKSSYWYAPSHSFLCDRWQFILPQFQNYGVGEMLMAEAEGIADASDLEFINYGKVRGKRRLMMFPRVIEKQRA